MARILTFQDIMQFYDSNSLGPTVGADDSANPFIKTQMVASSNTGVWNAIYGAQAWYQLNTEANLFGLLPKLTWDKSGFRAISAFTRAATAMAIAETGSIPAAVAPTITTIKLTPKIAVNTFQTTQVVEQLAKLSQDDIFANLDTIRMFYATEHVKLLNQQLNQLVVGTNLAACNQYSSSSPVFESIDRIVASYAEGTTCATSNSTTLNAIISPWNNAVSRGSAASAYDAYVAAPSGTINVAAYLTDGSIRNLIQGTRTNGGFNNVFVTGYNTYAEIQGLYLSNWRTATWGELRIDTGLNGIHAADGVDVGVKVASLFGIPLISAVDTPASQGTVGVQNVYLLDTTDTEGYGDARLGAQILNPTNYLETSARDFILLQYLAYEGMYMSIGELACRFLSAQGKLRDIN
jgi:hypothetical protein